MVSMGVDDVLQMVERTKQRMAGFTEKFDRCECRVIVGTSDCGSSPYLGAPVAQRALRAQGAPRTSSSSRRSSSTRTAR